MAEDMLDFHLPDAPRRTARAYVVRAWRWRADGEELDETEIVLPQSRVELVSRAPARGYVLRVPRWLVEDRYLTNGHAEGPARWRLNEPGAVALPERAADVETLTGLSGATAHNLAHGQHIDRLLSELEGLWERYEAGERQVWPRIHAVQMGILEHAARNLPPEWEVDPECNPAEHYDGEAGIAAQEWGLDETRPRFWWNVQYKMVRQWDMRAIRPVGGWPWNDYRRRRMLEQELIRLRDAAAAENRL